MDLLLNANIAYLLLVLGFILTLLAIVTPGTGLLEVGALFCLALVAFIIYSPEAGVEMNLWALAVLILGLVPFIYATRRPKYGPWLALSILCTLGGSLYLFNSAGSGWMPRVNPFVAVAASLLAGGFIWLVVGKSIKASLQRPTHDLETLIGQVGEAKTKIHEAGSVQVAGELWSARSEKEIASGKPVRVVGREGFTLVVEKAGE
jgi:membrane-bound serine protease (ClpP class)